MTTTHRCALGDIVGFELTEPTGAAVHSRIHTEAYYSEVNSLVGLATTRFEALEVLAYIRSQLLSGLFP